MVAPVGSDGKAGPHEIGWRVEEFAEPAVRARLDNPVLTLAQILLAHPYRMLAAVGNHKRDLGSF